MENKLIYVVSSKWGIEGVYADRLSAQVQKDHLKEKYHAYKNEDILISEYPLLGGTVILEG